jgi:hypothetical protein
MVYNRYTKKGGRDMFMVRAKCFDGAGNTGKPNMTNFEYFKKVFWSNGFDVGPSGGARVVDGVNYWFTMVNAPHDLIMQAIADFPKLQAVITGGNPL